MPHTGSALESNSLEKMSTLATQSQIDPVDDEEEFVDAPEALSSDVLDTIVRR